MNGDYREVELPNESFELPWSTYNDLRIRIRELEQALNTAQDTIGDIRTKWKALKAKYDGWITNEEFIALSETLKDVE